MPRIERKVRVELDLNSQDFQIDLFGLQKAERHSAMETMKKLLQMNWDQVYRDNGLKWEKVATVQPPEGMPTVYSLRLTQSRRATAYRDGNAMRFISIPADHDATYGKK